MTAPSIDTITNLCKRRGIVFPSSEIYGGLRSAWDWGPLGVELKRNVKAEWWRSMVHLRGDVVGLESSILMSSKVWEASGHVATFTDPLVECTNCHHRFRADHIDLDKSCPDCGQKAWTEVRQFNLMFKTQMGPVEDSANAVYLRPETAQGMFVDFLTVQQASRKKIPFGIAQQGKSFRNEITPRNFVFRTREFEQMEMEFFVKPGTDDEWHDYWLNERMSWYLGLGIRQENLRLREHTKDELSHYAKRTFDIEYNFPAPMGWSELEGIANRTDFDLKAHSAHSGEDLSYFDAETEERYVPYVIEPAVGVERPLMAFLIDAFTEEEAPTASGKMEKRTVLKLDQRLAPYKVAVLPLSKQADLLPVAEKLAEEVRPHLVTDFDVTGSIGKRYRRQDEVGTPFCVTVDFDSLTDNQVTVRERDSMEQERIPMDGLVDYLRKRFEKS
jgi:glycyl-tRNA synthetase